MSNPYKIIEWAGVKLALSKTKHRVNIGTLHVKCFYLQIFIFVSILTTGNVPQGRTWHSLSAVSDRHLFLYGGFSNDEEALGDHRISVVRSIACW